MTTTIKEGNARLLRLAEFLDTLPPERWNYEVWVDTERWEGKPDLSCGTQACALGWACAMPEFQELGVRLLKTTNSWGDEVARFLVDGYEDAGPLAAAKRLFGLNSAEVDRLFIDTPSHLLDEDGNRPDDLEEVTPKHVAAEIRAFVAERGDGGES